VQATAAELNAPVSKATHLAKVLKKPVARKKS
jgi:hypothetical protein